MSQTSASTLGSIKTMLKILGFDYAEDKLEPFSREAEMLGVVVDLSRTRDGKIVVANKPGRDLEMAALVSDMLKEKSVKTSLLPSIMGRICFAESQLMGRIGKLAMADLRSVTHDGSPVVKFDDQQLRALECLLERFSRPKGREVQFGVTLKPVVIFTDGAYEDGDEGATIGGVVIAPGMPVEVFGALVPDQLISQWKSEGKVHLIGPIDMYAIVVARSLWKTIIGGRRALLFVDNWPVLDTFVKGTAVEKIWRQLLMVLEKED